MQGYKVKKRVYAWILSLVVVLTALAGCQAADSTLPKHYEETGKLLSDSPELGVGSIYGEWKVIGLARAGLLDADKQQDYVEAATNYVTDIGSAQLHPVKSTDNSRLILGLTAAGADVTNVGGYNLLEGLANTEYIEGQGLNGPIWALIAFDSGDYEIPKATEAGSSVTREWLVQTILEAQQTDGGWSLTGTDSDVDITAMAIQALAPYMEDGEVEAAVNQALSYLSAQQNADGGFSSWGTVNSESCSQVIVALTSLQLDPTEDVRFIKNNRTVLDALDDFWVKDGFCHSTDMPEADPMATEQAYYAMVSYVCLTEQRGRLYDFTQNNQSGAASGTENQSGEQTCTISIECSTVLNHMEDLTAGKEEIVPEQGVILETETVEYEAGASVYDVLLKVCQEHRIPMESSWTPMYNSAYIEGIQNLYEFDCGELSGWMYCVNGEYPNYGCSAYEVKPGDVIEWHYTCDLGKDLKCDWIENE